jgi:hypothetical protein
VFESLTYEQTHPPWVTVLAIRIGTNHSIRCWWLAFDKIRSWSQAHALRFRIGNWNIIAYANFNSNALPVLCSVAWSTPNLIVSVATEYPNWSPSAALPVLLESVFNLQTLLHWSTSVRLTLGQLLGRILNSYTVHVPPLIIVLLQFSFLFPSLESTWCSYKNPSIIVLLRLPF